LIANKQNLSPGLYLVATPIGNARDITLRALDVLASADVLAAEDTRTLRRLMEIHGLQVAGRPLVAYHDHSNATVRSGLLERIRQGASVAYASEAGTPLVADPGYRLAGEALAEGLPVTAVPGASALLAALSVAGLPSDRFTFAGFAPTAGSARARFLEGLAKGTGTLIFYESPRRVSKFLTAAAEVLGGQRPAALCRELTKKFEEVRRGTLAELAARDWEGLKGEVVILVGPPGEVEVDDIDLEQLLAEALTRLSLKEAAEEIARSHGLKKRDVYQRGLALKGR